MAKLTIDQALQKAIAAHKAGRIQEADRIYTAIMHAQPNHPDANHNMGVLAVSVGKVEQALPFFKTALEANPATAQFWLSYIDALIKLDQLAEAKTVLDQAKSKGFKDNVFDDLEKRISGISDNLSEKNTPSKEKYADILNKLKLDQAVKLARKRVKEGAFDDAKIIYQNILEKFPKNKKVNNALRALTRSSNIKNLANDAPPKEQLQTILKLYNQSQHQKALKQVEIAIQKHPQSFMLFSIKGTILKGMGQLDLCVEAYSKAISIKPDYADGYYNLGNALQSQGNLDQAIFNYKRALKFKPNYIEAYNNMGVALEAKGEMEQAVKAYKKVISVNPNDADALNNLGVSLERQGKLDQAVDAFTKSTNINPNHADAFNNLGTALDKQGNLEQAMEVYRKALALKPGFLEAHNNLGNTLKDLGNREEAVKAYNKALSINSNFAESHRLLSLVTQYRVGNPQIKMVETLLGKTDLTSVERAKLHYTFAKMHEDTGNIGFAFENYVMGGNYRKISLGYNLRQDEELFSQVKESAPRLNEVAKNTCMSPKDITPIFIVGMPRSGTTLVEQILSSHSEITGAGELNFVSSFGAGLATGLVPINITAINEFRSQYLDQLRKRASGNNFVTDKLPQNFRYIALICTSFPEAKIVHVQRQASATAWSNFKHYFASDGLGYSYTLDDTVKYYNMYRNLMEFWKLSYEHRIITVDYEKLTVSQETHIRKLVNQIGLNWENSCLSPHNNMRLVRTASQYQVRNEIYQGSSHEWEKFSPFLEGVFDGLQY